MLKVLGKTGLRVGTVNTSQMPFILETIQLFCNWAAGLLFVYSRSMCNQSILQLVLLDSFVYSAIVFTRKIVKC